MIDYFKQYIENAIKWAMGQMDSMDYHTLCLGFVEKAYEVSNNIEIFGGSTAKESADEYGTNKTPRIPPRGAFVFYDCYGTLRGTLKNWGHVGISLGDGTVIHAWDKVRMDDYHDIEKLQSPPGWNSPQYIGWTSVERILQGYQKHF